MAQRIIRIQQSLKVAAEAADINGLYGSIKEDPHVLDRIDAIPFVDTPLHIAASAGHTDFAIEILRLKPSFGRKLNPDGLSSLHLALISDKFETVKRLIDFDKELIRVKGKEGITPLHFIAKKDINAEQQQREEDPRLNILAEFLFACPDSIEDLTIQNETALHIAVRTKNQGAVEVILGCIRRINKKRVLPNKDKEGNTALHVAVSDEQLEMVKLLVTGLSADTNEKDSEGRTALDIARSLETDEAARIIESSLSGARALESSPPHYSIARFLNSHERPSDLNVALTVAAEKGDINGLYGLIERAPKVLDDIDAIPFVDTPLHTAASAGHTDFAIEILRLMPSFGRKLNPKGESSLHLALINKKFETVKRLIKFDKELIRVKGRKGTTPLHLIAEKPNNGDQQQRVANHIDILAEFLIACPNSIEDLTIRDETALHIAVKTKNERAVQVILGFIRKTARKGVLDYKDKQGKTALHMAVSTSQDVIVSSLRRAKASSSPCLMRYARYCLFGASERRLPDHSPAEFLISPERPWEVSSNQRASKERQNTGLVVAVLVATATFTAVLSPPGGVGGPGDNNCLTNGSNINAAVSSTNNLFAANTSFINATLFVPTDDPIERLLFKDVNAAGVTYGHVFRRFYDFNTCAFVLSMLAIMIYLPFHGFIALHCALVFLMISYGMSFYLIAPSYGYAQNLATGSLWWPFLVYLFRSVRLLLFKASSKRVTSSAKPRQILLNRLMRNNVGE